MTRREYVHVLLGTLNWKFGSIGLGAAYGHFSFFETRDGIAAIGLCFVGWLAMPLTTTYHTVNAKSFFFSFLLYRLSK